MEPFCKKLHWLPMRHNDKNDEDAVTLMPIHSAKGLEFKYVFIDGMEEDLFSFTNDAE